MTAAELCRRLYSAYRGDCFEVVNDRTVRYYESFDSRENDEPHDVAWGILCGVNDAINGVIPEGWERGEPWSDNDSLGFDITRRKGEPMTDETRADLRRSVTEMVQVCEQGGYLHIQTGEGLIPTVTMWGSDPQCCYPPLTPDKQLALSVLVGDEAVIPQLLADYLLDLGHEYARECYEKGKREERDRVMAVIGQAGEHMSAVLLSELIVAVESGRPPNPKAFFVSASGRV